ncbi:MAG: hypothetical protein LC657_06190, partial [Desulfobacteraceae bacterium]|nr:hypothetical protein [Desulfobacteraceae bacterium]
MPKRYPHILLPDSPTEFPFTSSSIPIKKRIPTNRNRQAHSDFLRERNHLKKWDKKTRYSLVVTIKTPEENVDIYTPVAIK